MSDRPPQSKRPDEAGGAGAGEGGGRVLVVDDNALFARAAVSLLTALGVRADLAPDGFAALAALAQTPYDLVLLDWEMPRLDGRRTAIEIRRRYGPALPIIVTSAHTNRLRRELGPDAGIDDILTKPFDRLQLETTLWRWLRRPPGVEASSGGRGRLSSIPPVSSRAPLSSNAPLSGRAPLSSNAPLSGRAPLSSNPPVSGRPPLGSSPPASESRPPLGSSPPASEIRPPLGSSPPASEHTPSGAAPPSSERAPSSGDAPPAAAPKDPRLPR
jgi:CheY-like chemotaxis protein